MDNLACNIYTNNCLVRKFLKAGIGEQIAVVTFILAVISFFIKLYAYIFQLGYVNFFGINKSYINVECSLYLSVLYAGVIFLVFLLNIALYYWYSKKSHKILWIIVIETLAYTLIIGYIYTNISPYELIKQLFLFLKRTEK